MLQMRPTQQRRISAGLFSKLLKAQRIVAFRQQAEELKINPHTGDGNLEVLQSQNLTSEILQYSERCGI